MINESNRHRVGLLLLFGGLTWIGACLASAPLVLTVPMLTLPLALRWSA